MIRKFVCLALMVILTLPMLTGAQDNYIPSVSLDNYWTSFGSPQIDASLAGTNEFDRGDTVDVYVTLTNYGRIMGFDADKKADTRMEQELASREFDFERERTTALGITATLRSTNDLIEVKSGDQIIEALRSGDRSKDPMTFTIKIANHAPAGDYPLELGLTYDYQYNAEVDADELDPEIGLRGFQTGFWYETANQTIVLPMMVKKEADFVIINASADLKVGLKDGIVDVAYKNIGEEPTDEAIARISIFNPFSSSDDQAYIGTLQPGEERTVKFKVDVDDDATPKPYGINSEIKYKDIRGDTIISQSMKIPVIVEPAKKSYTMIIVLVLVVLLVIGGGYLYRKRA